MITDPELERQWNELGYAVLKQAVPHDLIDAVNRDVAAFRATCGETKDEHGYGQRIGLFHAHNPNSLSLALNENVREFLQWAFDDEPLLYGSLTFETGTEQGPHQDSVFFHTDPMLSMAGAWCALEDIEPASGPLFYYPGSHLWGFDRGEDVLRRFPEYADRVEDARNNRLSAEARQELANELGNKWHELLHEKIAERGAKPEPTIIKKGDVLVWQAHLVHGGLARDDRTLSRRSMVTHFIGSKACIFDMATFFLCKNDEFDQSRALHLRVKDDPRGPYVKHAGKPVTY